MLLTAADNVFKIHSLHMNKFDLSPIEHLAGPDAANEYDERVLAKLAEEREWILDRQSSRIGRTTTRLAGYFYRGDLGVNRWQADHVNRRLKSRRLYGQYPTN